MIDYWKLIRPRILAMVLFAMFVAAWTAGDEPLRGPALAHALLGAGLVIAGAVSLNQRMEFASDAKMGRTAARPLPAGRLTNRQVARFGGAASVAGLLYLGWLSNPVLVGLTALSWILYVWTYTPLKSRSAWQTPVGAVAGAMPVLLGAAAAGAPWSPTALTLFATLFFWQFPHSMAIAWLYRQEFARAEVKVASVVDPTGRTTGMLAIFGATALMLLAGVPPISAAAWQFRVGVAVAGGLYLLAAILFARVRSETSARWLLRASLVYLPAVLVGLIATRW